MVQSATGGKQFVCSCFQFCYRLITLLRVYSHLNQQGLLADKEREGRWSGYYFFLTVCEIHFSGFIEALDAKGILRTLSSETISDSVECYAGFSVLFELSAACM